MSEMVFPQIGLGGTPLKMLEEGYHNAYSALLAAKAAMLGLEFNSRDYPKFEDWEQACKERESVFSKIEDVETYIVEHINAICEAGDNERERCAQIAKQLAKNPLNGMCETEGAK